MDSFEKLKDDSCADNTGFTECYIINAKISLEFLASKEIYNFHTSLKWLSRWPCGYSGYETLVRTPHSPWPVSFVTKKATGTLPGVRCIFHTYRKHCSLQINGKEGRGQRSSNFLLATDTNKPSCNLQATNL